MTSSTTTLPDYEQVVRLPRELGPISVPESFRDENDHMNIRHYFDLCVEAGGQVFERIGITDEYRASRGTGFFTAEHHIRYYAETRIGEEVSVYVRGVDRSDKVVHVVAMLVNDTTRRLSCTLEITAIHVDLRTRAATAFAADIATAIDRELAADVAEWPVPVCGAMGIRR
ncbi:thioesterase family protein [Nocardia carnea]|uniref:Thioesterase family protein n=1 Tax=Nocardia carnea TaxID=37328 RepID=A0ABW7TTM4_9NOCA|nr:thioesterase family protein [Nocardia carnea]